MLVFFLHLYFVAYSQRSVSVVIQEAPASRWCCRSTRRRRNGEVDTSSPDFVYAPLSVREIPQFLSCQLSRQDHYGFSIPRRRGWSCRLGCVALGDWGPPAETRWLSDKPRRPVGYPVRQRGTAGDWRSWHGHVPGSRR